MADCPGVLHLADMADGGLARLRAPGGALSADQVRAVADASERLGLGVVDLTNRANLQIRGLARGAGEALAQELEAGGFQFFGEADRRRNILLDPFSGIDPAERLDMRPLAAALDDALVSAPWIGNLSPKFSFVLDGGGTSGVSAMASDVVALAVEGGVEIAAGGMRATAGDANRALAAMLALAEAAAHTDPGARAADLAPDALGPALRAAGPVRSADPLRRRRVQPRYGMVGSANPARVALSLPVPVGRLNAAMLRFLADVAEAFGTGSIVLAPWSAVVIPSVAPMETEDLLTASEVVGFLPIAIAERLTVIACAGAPACERAREPAKALGAEILRLVSQNAALLPAGPRSLHLSACPKGCAGSAPADLLLLGDSARSGWTIHSDAAPRRPGEALGRIDRASAADALALLSR